MDGLSQFFASLGVSPLLRWGDKIGAIKLIREASGLDMTWPQMEEFEVAAGVLFPI